MRMQISHVESNMNDLVYEYQHYQDATDEGEGAEYSTAMFRRKAFLHSYTREAERNMNDLVS